MISRQAIRASRLCCARSYATGAATPPPMLLKIRKDLKTAMQNKDANRLTVLRALLSQTLNASKTSSPINTDMQMLALLRKTTAESKGAIEEFKKNGREDLAEKEENQIRVLEEYAGDVEVVGEQEIRSAVEGVVAALKGETVGEEKKMHMGDVLKAVFKPEVFGGKNVDRGEVARVVKEVLAGEAKKA